jgi:quercetin dioxygenase-like cupin family protein
MKSLQLLEQLNFHDKNPYAEPVHVDKVGRVLRFTLKPGQQVIEHNAPESPVYLLVLKGHGLFAGGDGQEQSFGPSTLLIFGPGENHTIRAVAEELVFVAILHGTSHWH